MTEPAKVLIVSAEPQAGALWQKTFAESNLEVRLSVATTGIDGVLALSHDRPHALVVTHDPPGIDGPKVVESVRKDHYSLPLLVFAADAAAISAVLRDDHTLAAWADAGGAYRATAPALLGQMLSYAPRKPAAGPPGSAADAALAVALEIAGRSGQEVNSSLQLMFEQLERLRGTLSHGSPARPALGVLENALRQASVMTERILHCAKALEGVKIRLGLHDLLRTILRILREQMGGRLGPELRLQATRHEIEADLFQLSRALVGFLHAWAEAYGAIGGRMTLATDNPRANGSTASAGFALAVRGDEIRLRVVGRGETAQGAEFEPGADPSTTQGILPVAALAEAARACGGRMRLDTGPSREPVVSISFPLAPGETRPETTTGLADLRGTGHVLLVDDELIVRALAEKMLTSLGYLVTAVVDGPTAVRLFQADPSKFDLVLADSSLTEMTTVQLFQELKAIRPGVRFVLATDNPNAVPALKEGPGGCAGIVQKPYRVRDLGSRLMKILRY